MSARLVPVCTKRLLVDFRRDTPPSAHPQLAPYLAAGWALTRVDYRVVPAVGPRLLVTLVRIPTPAQAA